MKQTTIIIGAILLIGLMAGAAFMAARMWAATGQEGSLKGSGPVLKLAGGGEGPQMVQLNIEPAPELPDRPAEVRGIFVRREDDNIFVGTGEIQIRVEMDAVTGQPTFSNSHEGPVVEVVVNRETTIYQDTTPIDFEPGGDGNFQQQVQKVDSLEGLGEESEVQVWGERRGDRVVAEVFVVRNPVTWRAGK